MPKLNKSKCGGGRSVDSRGYMLVLKPNHPHCYGNGYILEHRFIIEELLGRYLLPGEVVHHKGTKYPLGSRQDKADNRIENLQLFKSENEHKECHHAIKYPIALIFIK